MLQNINALCGHNLVALDGEIGRIKDFYFDDKLWVVRYLVADTGSWMTGRLVLLSPHAFGTWNLREKMLHVKLSKQQIQDSPSIESHKPVSRQYEIDYYRYYGWPAYWNGDAIWGLGGYPVVAPPSREQTEAQQQPHPKDDKHLQSMHSITGYKVQALDETLGRVTGFRVDDRSWVVCHLSAESGPWYSSRELLIAPAMVDRISYEESTIHLNRTKANILLLTENCRPLPSAAISAGLNFGI